MKIRAFWDVMRCSLGVDRRFRVRTTSIIGAIALMIDDTTQRARIFMPLYVFERTMRSRLCTLIRHMEYRYLLREDEPNNVNLKEPFSFTLQQTNPGTTGVL
jgi:hypothetical protein